MAGRSSPTTAGTPWIDQVWMMWWLQPRLSTTSGWRHRDPTFTQRPAPVPVPLLVGVGVDLLAIYIYALTLPWVLTLSMMLRLPRPRPPRHRLVLDCNCQLVDHRAFQPHCACDGRALNRPVGWRARPEDRSNVEQEGEMQTNQQHFLPPNTAVKPHFKPISYI